MVRESPQLGINLPTILSHYESSQSISEISVDSVNLNLLDNKRSGIKGKETDKSPPERQKSS